MTAANADRCAEVAKPFGLVPHFVLLIKELTTGAFWLYVHLCTRASRKTGRCRVSLHRVAREKDMEIRTVQVWRAQLERLGLIVTSQKTGRSSEFLVIRHPELREWAKQQNLLNLGPSRHKFRTFGRKGAKTKAAASQLIPDSLPSESGFPPTEANPDSPITESKHSSVGNIETERVLSDRKAVTNCTASVTSKNEANFAEGHKSPVAKVETLKRITGFQGLDRRTWEEWLVSAFPGSPDLIWLMDQQDLVMSALGISSGEAQRILEKCIRKTRKEDSQTRLQEVVAEAIEALKQK